MKTKGQMEAEISNAMTKFEMEYMGRGPKETKAYIIDDMILVRLKGVLTDAERQLTKHQERRELVKEDNNLYIGGGPWEVIACKKAKP